MLTALCTTLVTFVAFRRAFYAPSQQAEISSFLSFFAFTVPEWKASQILAVGGTVYREETLAMAVVLTLVLSLTVGFAVGYQMSRWRGRSIDKLKDATNLSVDSNSSSNADYAQFPLSNSQVDSSSPPMVNGFNHNTPYQINNNDLIAPNQQNNNMAMMMTAMMMRDSVASSTATASTATSAGSGTQKRVPTVHPNGLAAAALHHRHLLQHHPSFKTAHYHHHPPPPPPPPPFPLQARFNPYAVESLLPTTNSEYFVNKRSARKMNLCNVFAFRTRSGQAAQLGVQRQPKWHIDYAACELRWLPTSPTTAAATTLPSPPSIQQNPKQNL